jgi:hypothetical protein
MATNTYTELARYVVTGSNLSGTTGVTFTGISSAYTDLRIVQSVTLTAAAIGYIQVGNGSIDTAANYSRTTLSGDGSSASSSRTSSTNQIGTQIAHQGTTIGTYTADFMNYSNTTTNKTVLIRNNNTGFGTEAAVGLWRSTSAINTVKLFLDRAEFYVVGSTFSLYGIASEEAAAKATGGMVTSDANYWYHTFTSSGTFTPKQSLSCDVLVVAGGGAGGGSQGAGGGAGGLLGFTSQSLPATTYSVTIGAGGAGVSASYNGAPGNNGTNSTFQGLTAAVGGGGGGTAGNITNGVGSGGSGGGRANLSGAGTGTINQGYAGGNTGIGGGGGAGAVGATGTNAAGGIGATFNTLVAGTAGPYSFINAMGAATGAGQLSSGNYYFAGGGGSGCSGVANGGLGGGGTGTVPAAAGTANTGGGGGGACGNPEAGAAGGSGIVIVRYPK